VQRAPVIRGYHGTSATHAAVILRDGFLPSDNDYDCLGTGVYSRKLRNTSDGYGLVAGLFAVYQDRAEKYRFRLKASETKSAAKRAASPCNGQLTAHRWWSKPTADPSLHCRPPTGVGAVLSR
jgi:hypothetical protein